MIHSKKHIAMMAVFAFMAACGTKNAGSILSAQKSPNATLVGRWTTGCKSSASPAGKYSIANYEYGGVPSRGSRGTLMMDTEFYDVSNCANDKINLRLRMLTRYTNDASTIATLFEGTKSYLTYYSQASVDTANAQRQCGDADWALGVEHRGCEVIQDGRATASYQISGRTLTLTTADGVLPLPLPLPLSFPFPFSPLPLPFQ